jgi:hypothetical protein
MTRVLRQLVASATGAALSLAALLGAGSIASACYVMPRPPEDAELHAAKEPELAFKGVITKVTLPNNFVHSWPHRDIRIELRPALVVRGAPGASITVIYGACTAIPGSVGETVNVLAARSAWSGEIESMR